MEERRRAARLSVRFEGFYEGGRLEGVGIVLEISRFGALIETTEELRPSVGARIRLTITAVEPPIQVDARVVGPVGRCFAVEFTRSSAELLDLIAKLAGSPG